MLKTALAAALLALPVAALAQTPVLELAAGHLQFRLMPRSGFQLVARGVPIIRENHLYLMKPGWTAAYLNQDELTPTVTSTTEGDARVGTALYETPDGSAKYRFELRPDDTFIVSLTFQGKTLPAVMEYDAGYINANLISGTKFTAKTVDGDKQGIAPLFAASAEQEASRLTPRLSSASFETALGSFAIQVDGTDDITKTLTLFDARGGAQDWARKNPVFWLGIGSPDVAVTPGEHTVTVTFSFGLPIPKQTIPAAEGSAKVSTLKAARIPWTPDTPVIPHPKEMSTAGLKSVRIGAGSAIFIPTDASPENRAAAIELQAEFRDFWGRKLPITRVKSAAAVKTPAGAAAIVVGPAAFAAAPKSPVNAHAEGYTLSANGARVNIAGTDPHGVYYGAQTLKQLIRADEKGIYVKAASIVDWPSLAMRGVHWFGGPNSWPFHKKMIDRILAAYKMNAMVYQADYTQWDAQPKIWSEERSTPKAQVKKTVDYARSHFIEPIPLVNTLGHSEWLFWNKQNQDIVADPATNFAYNPDNPHTYEVVFPIMQEAIDLFHPKYFHIGHDEVTTNGAFPPAGSTKTATQLILEDTNRMHDWLAKKGIITMMWGDMLLHETEATDAGLAPTKEDARIRRAGVPKDTIIADWHYQGGDPSFPSVDVLQKEGFKVVGTTWYDWGNIQNFSRVLNAESSMGFLQSTWAGYNMDLNIVRGEEMRQFVAYLLGAEYAWNGGQPGLDGLGYSADDAFLTAWNRQAMSMAKTPGFTVDLSDLSNARMWDWAPIEAPAASAKNAPFPRGKATIGGIAYQTGAPVWLAGALNPAGAWPKSVSIAIGGKKASEVDLLMGATFASAVGTPVAAVTFHYKDGSKAELPIIYGRDIFAFTDLRAGPNVTAAWRGVSPRGENASVRRRAYANPEPSRAIAKLTLTSLETESAPVLLGVTGIL
ncbi:MAG TPA: glycoside hydrolase family 20 zincin-like fold domain-containing protein [Armatimonadota bacterium]|jgi:hypothetical protein